ncbi:DUF6409 family protein [Streptomyces sp. CBMA123]|uniref:DUF6409 family protein n=1 Tax=Streptomyces sp. CBMA123 TaxID=1896313 RepID=UPI001661F16D|nr:DUF6409 family protein [Streptomyces sp. CBMA123]MBD0688532.1 hypothetical protein [Streptomyces sp. CBMA123]
MLTTDQAPTVQDFPAATLVNAGPWFRGHQLDPRPAIVVGPFGGPEFADTAEMVVVWYFTIGAPTPGDSVQAMFPHELTPLDDTLTTMDTGTFCDIATSLPLGRFPYNQGNDLTAAVNRAVRERIEAAPATRRS